MNEREVLDIQLARRVLGSAGAGYPGRTGVGIESPGLRGLHSEARGAL